MSRGFVAEQVYQFKATPAKVFSALTEPRQLVRWFLSDAKVSPEKGGEFDFRWYGGYHMVSRLTRYEPNRAVGFRWVDRMRDRSLVTTQVEFRVTKKGSGSLLHLKHSGFKAGDHFAECASRWAYYLTNLKSVLDHGTDLRSTGDW